MPITPDLLDESNETVILTLSASGSVNIADVTQSIGLSTPGSATLSIGGQAEQLSIVGVITTMRTLAAEASAGQFVNLWRRLNELRLGHRDSNAVAGLAFHRGGQTFSGADAYRLLSDEESDGSANIYDTGLVSKLGVFINGDIILETRIQREGQTSASILSLRGSGWSFNLSPLRGNDSGSLHGSKVSIVLHGSRTPQARQ